MDLVKVYIIMSVSGVAIPCVTVLIMSYMNKKHQSKVQSIIREMLDHTNRSNGVSKEKIKLP